MREHTSNRQVSGFSIIELMVALAIGGILLGIALPAFNGFMAQGRMTSEVNDFVLAVNYARSEAIKLGGIVSLRRNGDDWGGGYCVTVGTPTNCDNPLRIFDAVVDSTFVASDDLDVDTLSFNGRGLLVPEGIGGSMRLCSDDPDLEPGRLVELNGIGRTTVRELICNP